MCFSWAVQLVDLEHTEQSEGRRLVCRAHVFENTINLTHGE